MKIRKKNQKKNIGEKKKFRGMCRLKKPTVEILASKYSGLCSIYGQIADKWPLVSLYALDTSTRANGSRETEKNRPCVGKWGAEKKKKREIKAPNRAQQKSGYNPR